MAHIGDQFLSFIKDVTTQIEELQVQAALGKAEISDKLEELKRNAKDGFSKIQSEVLTEVAHDKEKAEKLKGKMDHLQVQLALAKAESEDEIAHQKKNLKAAFHDVKHIIETN